jgi:hypothetical protein
MSVVSDAKLAAIMLAAGFPADPKVIAEGLGVIHAESGGDPSSKVPGNEHMGLWAESSAFGTEAQRLNAFQSTVAAFKEWKKDGGFWQAWGQWETAEAAGSGPSRAPEYMATARKAISGAPAGSRRGGQGRQKPSQLQRDAASSAGGGSGAMKFLLTAALVLGGAGLMALGTMRAVGQRGAS